MDDNVSTLYQYRLRRATKKAEIHTLSSPFSIFSWVALHYDGNDAIHRCFSLARMYGAKTLVIERIANTGFLWQEAEDTRRLSGFDVGNEALRISFWSTKFKTIESCNEQRNREFIGYTILQRTGRFPSKEGDGRGLRWIVFEAVLNGRERQRGICPHPVSFRVRVGTKKRVVKGRIYCQQNGITAACGQVAIRTILSGLVAPSKLDELSYRSINSIAGIVPDGTNDKLLEMRQEQIEKVFNHFEFNVEDVYSLYKSSKEGALTETQFPFYRFLYSGIESGLGSLLGFNLKECKQGLEQKGRNVTITDTERIRGQTGVNDIGKEEESNRQHIIPLWGHTFNKHMWVNDALSFYFPEDIHEQRIYVSDNWTSTFIGHDDNIGPNVYMPRHYFKAPSVTYALSVLPRGASLSGIHAEYEALTWLSKVVLPRLSNNETNAWLHRLRDTIVDRKDGKEYLVSQLVLRAIFLSKEQYLGELVKAKDWNRKSEKGETVMRIGDIIPSNIWVVEFSMPHLFPANERKLGEFVFDASMFTGDIYKDQLRRLLSFVFVRIPEKYIVLQNCSFVSEIVDGKEKFKENLETCVVQSSFVSHIRSFVYRGVMRV